ncbi:LRR receptor-like serine/threonine-protein kinase [Rhizoctonia solani]|uniref:LRR receptor-like serine/threonine-protein kinase n=1 Tax=Rhizoctonia solani TaxID=456999 RepID=A0A8H8T2K4_9AGAM|nr:LRR receptor-like serine/threonine-protein kinase [Rhizoctonia solani]QRW25932.1 LRR receptor-like serine/threonine-protein kinase [Rhizoctonia solani]
MTVLTPAPEQPSLKVFGIPELAHLICSGLQRRDNAGLMRVCRRPFCYVLPFVWEEVDEANALVSMIPGGGIITYESELSPYVVMQLPSALELSRFNIYAPHVRRFTPCALHIDQYEGWERFLACTQSIDLLPNLEALYLPVDDYNWDRHPDRIQAESANWVTAFLSASLRTLRMIPSQATDPIPIPKKHWLGFNSTNNLMATISQRCPQLSSLEIFPDPHSWKVQFEVPLSQEVSFSHDSPQFYLNLVGLSNLSYLSISRAILSERALVAISTLHNLQSLRVLGHHPDNEIYCDDLQIPIDGFPVLGNLELCHLDWNTMVNICKSRPIVSCLNSMAITYPTREDSSHIHEQSVGLSHAISYLAANGATITTLLVKNRLPQHFAPEALQFWKRLPLTSVHLEMRVPLDNELEAFCALLSSMPLLEDLKLYTSYESFDLSMLKIIVELLPRLRSLRIPVEWKQIITLTEADFALSRSQNANPLHIRSDFYLPDPKQENAERVAR